MRAIIARPLVVVALLLATMGPEIVYSGLGTGPSRTQPYGALNAWTYGTLALTADSSVQPPPKVQASSSAVGLLKSFKWSGGSTDPIELVLGLSTANYDKLKKVDIGRALAPSSGHVVVFAYDQKASEWYTAFDCALGGPTRSLKLTATTREATVEMTPTGMCKLASSAETSVLKKGAPSP